MIRRCLFVGPTRLDSSSHPGFDRFGPASLGSIFRAVEAGYEQIGIVDGYFGSVPGPWHKEILGSLSRAEVWGASSTGALRAAELDRFGMKGSGAVYRLLRRGAILDDDEVCVAHAVPELGYFPLSHAMINVRATLRRFRRRAMITVTEESALAGAFKAVHFSERTDDFLVKLAPSILGPRAGAVVGAFREGYVDLKARDARLLCRRMAGRLRLDLEPPSQSHRTVFWRRQFEIELDQVPRLGDDPHRSPVPGGASGVHGLNVKR